METSSPVVQYRRRGASGTLSLGGIVDIFEAQSVHAAALAAWKDAKASSLKIDLSQLEQVDIAILQILENLRHCLDRDQRPFQIIAAPSITQFAKPFGLTL